MNNDLIERYIYAVTKRLSPKQRDDVARELRTLIDDMLTERCREVRPTEKDIRVVLTELGTPQELYAKYDENADKCLIGPPYYTTYKFVIKALISAAFVGVTIASLILSLLEPKDVFSAITSWFSSVWDVFVSGFTITTLAFAYCCHKRIPIGEPFNFDDLPPVPKKSQEISKWECIAGIFFSVLFMVLFIFTPEVFCVIHDGVMVSLFNMEVVSQTWFIVLAFAACGIVREAVQLLEGRYNKKVMATALITNAVSAVLSIWWLTGFNLMNPVFLANMKEIFAGESNIVFTMFANFDLFFLGCMLFALILDSVDVTVRTLRK